MKRPTTTYWLLRFASVALCGIIFFSGCVGGTETGNPGFSGQIAVNALSFDANRVELSARTDDSQSDILLREVWVNLGALRLTPAERCKDDTNIINDDTDDTIVVPASGVKDHGGAEALIKSYEAITGRYCRMDATLTNVASTASDEIPRDMQGYAVLLDGTSGEGNDFRVRLKSPGVVPLRAIEEGGFKLSSDEGNLFLGFDVSTWLQQVSFANATQNSEGVAIVDETSNTDLYHQIEKQLRSGLKLHRDENGDAELDESEVTPIAGGDRLFLQ